LSRVRPDRRPTTRRADFYSANNLLLGKCLMKAGKLEEAQRQLVKAFIAPCVTVDDKATKDEAMRILRTVGIDANDI